jgi:chaperonin cofactor prefoldin
LDRSILADPEIATREEIDRLLTIQRGIVTTETQRIRKTTLTLTNRGQRPADVYVRHKLQTGYELRKSTKAKLKIDKLGGAHLFSVSLPAGEAVKVVIEEQTPIMKTVDIRTPRGIGSIELYLKKGKVAPELRTKLEDIVKNYTAIANLQERIAVLDQQMAVYRTRVDEINVQLVTLKKVPQAAKLRRHLASKMEEISDKLQQSTMQMSDLKGQLMTLRIELQDKLADLTLKRDKKNADKSAEGGA